MEVKNAYPLLLLFLSLSRVITEMPVLGILIMNTSLALTVLYLFWHFKGLGGADVKILTALAIGEGIGVWVILLFVCIFSIGYALISRETKQEIPFVPGIFIGAVIEFFIGGYFG